MLSFLPQFLFKRIVRKLDKKQNRDNNQYNFNLKNINVELFNNFNDYFLEYLKNCKVYGEYGSGYSTLYSVDVLSKKTYSVETSKEWSTKVQKSIKNRSLLNLNYVDVGETGRWGWPIDYSKAENFKNYFNFIWEQFEKPDFILIDGRFRVATFLTTLKNANAGAVILFDDYVERKKYKIVEQFEKPIKTNERQAVFIVSKSYNIQDLNAYIDKFQYVMDWSF